MADAAEPSADAWSAAFDKYYGSSARSNPTPAGQERKATEPSIWTLFADPVIAAIKQAIDRSALIPIFIVECPYSDFNSDFRTCFRDAFPQYLIKNFDVDDGGDATTQSDLVKKIVEEHSPGLIGLTTGAFRPARALGSLMRDDSLIIMPALSLSRLRDYATATGRSIPDNQDDGGWVRWLTPGHLLLAQSITDERWLATLRDLAMRREKSFSAGIDLGLADLCGIDDAVRWARRLTADIRAAMDKQISWREVDRGALLVGEPGTGKTTFARAMARDAGVSFIQVSAAMDWMSGDGLGGSLGQVRRSFALARQLAPSVLFIDEIDAIGNRSLFNGQNASWNTSFLDGVLTEFDGLNNTPNVIILAATNLPDNVDPALKRAGRLDRQINLPRPDRAALIELYRRGLADTRHNLDDAALRECADISLGLTGADIQVVLRSARRRARLDHDRPLEARDIIDEIYGIPHDAPRQPLYGHALEVTAYHEAGHALIGLLLPSLTDRVNFASIIPGSDGALGFTATLASEHNDTRSSLLDRIAQSLAGRAAERIKYGEDAVTTGAGGGAGSDLFRARRLADAYIGRFGFAANAPDWYDSDKPDEVEARAIIAAQRDRAMKLLTANRSKLDAIAQALLAQQVLDRKALVALVEDCSNG